MTTKIEWVRNPDGTKGETWNPCTGCSKVSAGCKFCFAERMARRLAGRYGYPEAPHHFDVTLRRDRLDIPLRRKKPTMYFVCSMSDLFHEDVPTHYIADVWNVMRQCPQHVFQVLTKRPYAMLSILSDWGLVLPNVWLGVTAENQAAADERIPLLLQCPAAVRFVSVEPLLGAVNLMPYLLDCNDCAHRDFSMQGTGVLGGASAYKETCDVSCEKTQEAPPLDWVICGGESGPGARPMHPDWARSLRDQCQASGTPYFYKQHGAWLHESQTPKDIWGTELSSKFVLSKEYKWPDGTASYRVGKRAAGRLLDGQTWDEFPKET